MQVEADGPDIVIETDSEQETEALGRALAEIVEPGTVIGLIGPLGAGKTRLARALAEALGVDPRAISSPTFVLIHEYEGRLPVYHFDAYRLVDTAEFDALGPADYFQAAGVCLVEWADRVPGRLPRDAWSVRLESLSTSRRRIRISCDKAADLARRLTGSPAADGPI
jgi:tRNA threonylcarbamoyladenosine biosynthesis protein TsaE